MTKHQKPASIAKAIGNRRRFAIINSLMKREQNVSELNKLVRMTQPALSQHLSRLRAIGIVKGRREGREIFYSISNPKVSAVVDALLKAGA